jgi:hypothetical protein
VNSVPRWCRISFRATLVLLAVAAAVFLWAAVSPMGAESDEWFKLGAAIGSALTGFFLIAVLLVLLIVRWIKSSARIGPLILILVALGCEEPPSAGQQGVYCDSGGPSGMFGRVHIMTVCGNKLGSSGEIIGPMEHVFYVATSLPGPRVGGGGSSESGPTRSIWKETHELESGRTVRVHVEWDRVRDVVTLAGRKFDRKAGNVLLVEVDAGGTQTSRQNSKVRSERVPEREESRVLKEEFPHLAPALAAFP